MRRPLLLEARSNRNRVIVIEIFFFSKVIVIELIEFFFFKSNRNRVIEFYFISKVIVIEKTRLPAPGPQKSRSNRNLKKVGRREKKIVARGGKKWKKRVRERTVSGRLLF